jgi:hypothetical protein
MQIFETQFDETQWSGKGLRSYDKAKVMWRQA